MTRAEFIESLRESLNDAASVFSTDDTDYLRHLDMALRDFSQPNHRPLRKRGTLTLVADTRDYDAPADFQGMAWCDYGTASREQYRPWQPQYMTTQFVLIAMRGATGWQLRTARDVTSDLIALHGSACGFFYYATHILSEIECSVRDNDMPLLLLRAQAEAMREMSIRNIFKPVQLRTGVAGAPSNGTPGGLYSLLMDYYEASF
ncbi:MAG TPA: hypothetical protein DIC36_00945 [Gammaproteobacteria bacterium]|nr:hypothetical protein [Gammaproteobacteria bacterium]